MRTRRRDAAVTDLATAPPSRSRRARRALERAYWDRFVNEPPAVATNLLPSGMRSLPIGAVNSVKAELHAPEIMSEHVREIALKFGVQGVGIVRIDGSLAAAPEQARFATVLLVRAEYDPDEAPGFGGQVAVQNGLLASFLIAAYFRESGYFAVTAELDRAARVDLAVRAGLGHVDRRGRFTAPGVRRKVHVADIVFTDFPLAELR